MEQVTNRRN